MHNEMFIWDQCEVYEELICLLTMPESARSVPDCFIAGLQYFRVHLICDQRSCLRVLF